MTFKVPYVCYESPCTCSGDSVRPVYTLVNTNGERSLKKVDEVDIQESINSYEAETDLKAMLRRYSLSGDASVLRKGVGQYVYADVSACETDYARLIQRSREIALLKLQASSVDEKVSEEGKEKVSLNQDPVSDPSNNIPVSEKTEVTNE